MQGLLLRVEDAVDKFLYWDEEVTLIEAVSAESVSHYHNNYSIVYLLYGYVF